MLTAVLCSARASPISTIGARCARLHIAKSICRVFCAAAVCCPSANLLMLSLFARAEAEINKAIESLQLFDFMCVFVVCSLASKR
jgi:hypothetical protein